MTKENLKDMLEKQFSLNIIAAGPLWPTGVTSEGNNINWGRTIYMESAELIDSFPWKHWKDLSVEPDWLNVKVELIDIWHFLMSLSIEYVFEFLISTLEKENIDSSMNKERINYYWETIIKESITEFIFKIYEEGESKDFTKKIISLGSDKRENFIRIIEEIMLNTIHISKIKEEGKDLKNKKALIFSTIALFFKIIQDYIDMDLEKVFNGKNILNKFRQEHGYKNGSYKKIWKYKGKVVEDNVVMIDKINSKDLYFELEKIYGTF